MNEKSIYGVIGGKIVILGEGLIQNFYTFIMTKNWQKRVGCKKDKCCFRTSKQIFTIEKTQPPPPHGSE